MSGSTTPHPSTIDLRTGVIVSATHHPDASTLYLLKIQCDPLPSPPRTVLTSLVNLLPLNYFSENPRCVVACNFKPITMRGIQSQGMVLTAAPVGKEDEGPVELVKPPERCMEGETLVWEDERAGEDGVKGVLNPKRKVWEKVKMRLGTDGEGVMVFRIGDEGEGEGREGAGKVIRLGSKRGEDWGWCRVETIQNGMVS